MKVYFIFMLFPVSISSVANVENLNLKRINHQDPQEENRYLSIYRRSKPFYNERYQFRRFSNPHRYWYMYNLRKSNPTFYYQNMRVRNSDKSDLLQHVHNTRPPDSDHLKSYKYKLNRSVNNQFSRKYFKRKERNSRNSNNFQNYTKSVGDISPKIASNELNNRRLIGQEDSNNSRKKIENSNIGKFKGINATTTNTLNYTQEPLIKEEKRDVSKAKRSNVSFGRNVYQNLSRFGLLYLLWLLLIFMSVASLTLVVVQTVSFCWGAIKCQKGANVTHRGKSKEVTIESAVFDELKAIPATYIKPPKDIHDKFISNEFDGKDDTTRKRRKLEKWTMQDFSSKKKSYPGIHRNIKHVDTQSASEGTPDSESDLENALQSCLSQDESEASKQHQDPMTMEQVRYKPHKMKNETQKTRYNNTANRNESQPFNVPPHKLVTIGRVYNAEPKGSRQMYSLLEHYTKLPKRASYSMVDINPRRFSRL